MFLERTKMVSVKLNSRRPTALACGVIAADDRSSPSALLVGTIGMSALPVRVVLSIIVAPFDATLMGAKPLLPKGRYRLVVLDLVWLAAILANLCANAALPKRAIFTRPELSSPLTPALQRAELIKACSRRSYRILLLTPLTLDDDGHGPSYYKYGPQVKA
jgi:hypothetical protein